MSHELWQFEELKNDWRSIEMMTMKIVKLQNEVSEEDTD